MFIVELAFDGGPERLAARPAHRERLAILRDAGKVVMAGPFPDESGALLIFNVGSAAELGELMDADPYYTTAGVRVTDRREWMPFIT
jgi:hypothetical protein